MPADHKPNPSAAEILRLLLDARARFTNAANVGRTRIRLGHADSPFVREGREGPGQPGQVDSRDFFPRACGEDPACSAAAQFCRRLGTRAGLEWNSYKFRHTFATTYALNGGSWVESSSARVVARSYSPCGSRITPIQCRSRSADQPEPAPIGDAGQNRNEDEPGVGEGQWPRLLVGESPLPGGVVGRLVKHILLRIEP